MIKNIKNAPDNPRENIKEKLNLTVEKKFKEHIHYRARINL